MINKLVVAILFLILFAPNSKAGDFQSAAGIGFQYGIVGGQFSYKEDLTKYYLSLGMFGGGIGFKRALEKDSKHAFGAIFVEATTFVSDHRFAGLTYNYHFNGFTDAGWVVGVSAGRIWYVNNLSPDVNDDKYEYGATINIGYQFWGL
ncbi:MAG: hypothetical protein COA86_07005 [Kangiella sp.]|nr:MAG: hypothetical protein COA86_07005 [Kangiella sp.]